MWVNAVEQWLPHSAWYSSLSHIFLKFAALFQPTAIKSFAFPKTPILIRSLNTSWNFSWNTINFIHWAVQKYFRGIQTWVQIIVGREFWKVRIAVKIILFFSAGRIVGLVFFPSTFVSFHCLKKKMSALGNHSLIKFLKYSRFKYRELLPQIFEKF